jgi:hypothetical protein
MTSETVDLTKLYDIILRLTQKIDGLENKIDVLTSQVQGGSVKHPLATGGGGVKKTLSIPPITFPFATLKRGYKRVK